MGKKLFLFMNIIFFLIIANMFYSAFKVYLIKEETNKEIIKLEEKVNEYSEKKKKLEENISNFSEEEKVERIARDRLNMKKEGETIYQVITSESSK